MADDLQPQQTEQQAAAARRAAANPPLPPPAKIELPPADDGSYMDKLSKDISAHLAERKKEAATVGAAAPAAEAPAAPAAGSTPSPAPAPPPSAALPPALVARAKAAGWSDDEMTGQDAAALERSVARDERREVQLRRRLVEKPAEAKPPAPPPPEEKPFTVWGEKEGERKEDFSEETVWIVDRLTARYEAELENLRQELSPVREYVGYQYHQEQENLLVALTDQLHDAGWTKVGKGRQRQNTESYHAQGMIGALLAGDVQNYRQLGMEMTKEDLADAAKAHARRMWGETAAAKAPAAAAPPPAQQPPKPRDQETGRFTTTERPDRGGETEEAPSMDKAVRNMRRRLAAQTINGLGLADIHGPQ